MKRIYISGHKILMTITRYLDFKVMFSLLFSLIHKITIIFLYNTQKRWDRNCFSEYEMLWKSFQFCRRDRSLAFGEKWRSLTLEASGSCHFVLMNPDNPELNGGPWLTGHSPSPFTLVCFPLQILVFFSSQHQQCFSGFSKIQWLPPPEGLRNLAPFKY